MTAHELVLPAGLLPGPPELADMPVHLLACADDGHLYLAPLGTPPGTAPGAAWLDAGPIGMPCDASQPHAEFYAAAHRAWAAAWDMP